MQIGSAYSDAFQLYDRMIFREVRFLVLRIFERTGRRAGEDFHSLSFRKKGCTFKIMDALLKLKHWHIFMMTAGVYLGFLILQVVVELVFNETGIYTMSRELDKLLEYISVATSLATNAWFYAIGVKLSDRRPQDNVNTGFFISCIVVSTLYDVAQNFSWTYGLMSVESIYVLAIGVFAMSVYECYFVARALASVEMDTKASFYEFRGDVVLFLFHPIGVWWLQPRINRAIENSSPTVDPDAPLDQHLTM
jgi:hypothetical protein